MATLRPGFDMLDADDTKRLVKRVLKAMAVDPAALGSDRDPIRLVCRQIDQFKDDLVTPEEAPARVEVRIAEARMVRRAAVRVDSGNPLSGMSKGSRTFLL